MFLPKILSCTTLLVLGSLLAAFALLTSVCLLSVVYGAG
jgi:hypothetical protein